VLNPRRPAAAPAVAVDVAIVAAVIAADFAADVADVVVEAAPVVDEIAVLHPVVAAADAANISIYDDEVE